MTDQVATLLDGSMSDMGLVSRVHRLLAARSPPTFRLAPRCAPPPRRGLLLGISPAPVSGLDVAVKAADIVASMNPIGREVDRGYDFGPAVRYPAGSAISRVDAGDEGKARLSPSSPLRRLGADTPFVVEIDASALSSVRIEAMTTLAASHSSPSVRSRNVSCPSS
jgi:hypothetical protein